MAQQVHSYTHVYIYIHRYPKGLNPGRSQQPYSNQPTWKQPKGPSPDERINKAQSTQTMGYYSAMTRNEVVAHDTAWMNSEHFMPNENKPEPQRAYIV